MKLTRDKLKQIIKEELEEMTKMQEVDDWNEDPYKLAKPFTAQDRAEKAGKQIATLQQSSYMNKQRSDKLYAALSKVVRGRDDKSPQGQKTISDAFTEFFNELKQAQNEYAGVSQKLNEPVDKRNKNDERFADLTRLMAALKSDLLPNQQQQPKSAAQSSPQPKSSNPRIAELEKQLATFTRYEHIPAYKKRADEIRAQIAQLKK
jgi:hypothetical protein